MFRYVGDISELTHYIVNEFVENKNVAIDGTLGNGHDTDFLSEKFKKVYSFDIQKIACDNYKNKNTENVIVINDSHHLFNEYVEEDQVDCIMYNLGFLPGANKEITTMHETSLKSIEVGLELLSHGGIMTICIYRGHNEGKKEESCILSFLEKLPKAKYGVMVHSFLNRSNNPPMLVVVEKNNPLSF